MDHTFVVEPESFGRNAVLSSAGEVDGRLVGRAREDDLSLVTGAHRLRLVEPVRHPDTRHHMIGTL